MTQHLLIVGGYGHVGSLVAAELVRRGHAVAVAGRDRARAEHTGAALGGASAHIDVARPETWDAALEGASRVLVCIDQPDEAFARRVLERGLDYIDITASDRFFRRVETLGDLAERTGATAVLSVGLAPGLTNLLVREAAASFEQAREAQIAIHLGLGDTHGRAAIAWMLDELARASARPLREARFGLEATTTPACPFDFADQHVVQRTLGLQKAETLLSIESAFWTRALVRSRSLLRPQAVRNFATSAFAAMPGLRLGSDRCAVAVEVHGSSRQHTTSRRAGFFGRNEGLVTAHVAAHVVDALPRVRRPGVHHIERLFTLADLRETLTAAGGTTWLEGERVA
ncbi:saccharopine dehydrogenase NADP-binding domain-containing protein [Chondromyces crocatus]|uniref:Saccharopine dehydrogenase NADP binding domain-containing protein n=1 Tax=Chondromyces crocatus TaxID=52 RepID=A0A0K1EAZ3_CHOCO|nr:saccharopine dehydrogenase NADP-binding domain-containing protein [Chondromyces crocatus]AKT38051.1 uncharacterized protein CMC5_021920 [Chondromyces crocatus]